MNEITRALRVLNWATIGLFLVVAAFALYGWLDSRRIHHALCQFRGDLQARVEAEQRYLRETPNAIKGIPPAQIKTSIDNQQRTIDALDGLGCR